MEEYREMTLEQYWKILIKRWKLNIICMLLVGIGAFIGTRLLMMPLYQSSILVQIVIGSTDYNNLLASNLLVQTEQTLAVSNRVLQEVASHYPNLTAHQLAGEVTATPMFNTQLFAIDVVDPSPTRAADIANDIAATMIKQQSQTVERDNIKGEQLMQQNIDQVSKQIAAITVKITTLQAHGGNQGQIALLQAQLSDLQQQDSQLHISLVQLIQSQGGEYLRVAQPAIPALSPVRPSAALNTGAGLLGGLFLGMLLALLFELLDPRVRTIEALTQLLDWSVLGTIWQAAPKEDIIHPTGQNSNVESYCILRTNIGFSSREKALHTLAVTSPMSRDGKSVIAANLAIFIANTGKNTILIDADLRHPVQHNQFHLSERTMGFSNAIEAFNLPTSVPASQQLPIPGKSAASVSTSTLIKTSSLGPFVHAVDVPNLYVMPSGPLPPNPPDLLDSKAMQRFFAALANCGAEAVIFDTPPLPDLSDTSILASKVDGTLIVVDITVANKKKLKQAKTLLLQAGAYVPGCVVNKQDPRRNNRKELPGRSSKKVPVPSLETDTEPQPVLISKNATQVASDATDATVRLKAQNRLNSLNRWKGGPRENDKEDATVRLKAQNRLNSLNGWKGGPRENDKETETRR
jgi:capsular polysaccharide biosynthesis protein/Mrp family chromosome partitioning ATPase